MHDPAFPHWQEDVGMQGFADAPVCSLHNSNYVRQLIARLWDLKQCAASIGSVIICF